MATPCPCGRTSPKGLVQALDDCCGAYHANQNAPDAESLMRSRYSAFVRRAFGPVLFHGDDGRRCFFPGRKTAVDVSHIRHAHVLQGLGGQGAAPACTTKQDELLALVREHGLEVGRGRVHPEFEHAPGREQSAGQGAFALELTRIADIDDLHVRVAHAGAHRFHAVRRDLGHGLVDEDLKTFGNGHVCLLVLT